MNQQLASQAAESALYHASKRVLDSSMTTRPRWTVAAWPYLLAIKHSDYGLEDPVMCVLYALNNLTGWKGAEARFVKRLFNEAIAEDVK